MIKSNDYGFSIRLLGLTVYISESSVRNYIISCIDDCSRKVYGTWSERKRSVDVLNVIEEWIKVNDKSKTVMHDNGKTVYIRPQFLNALLSINR